jgi:hypothetical protein
MRIAASDGPVFVILPRGDEDIGDPSPTFCNGSARECVLGASGAQILGG